MSSRLRAIGSVAVAAARARGLGPAAPLRPRARWSTEDAAAWADETGWLLGCNFSPSTAGNQLELWPVSYTHLTTCSISSSAWET